MLSQKEPRFYFSTSPQVLLNEKDTVVKMHPILWKIVSLSIVFLHLACPSCALQPHGLSNDPNFFPISVWLNCKNLFYVFFAVRYFSESSDLVN